MTDSIFLPFSCATCKKAEFSRGFQDSGLVKARGLRKSYGIAATEIGLLFKAVPKPDTKKVCMQKKFCIYLLFSNL